MSNSLAIATVTAALAQTLRVAVQADVSGANVAMGRPDHAAGGAQADPEVRVYLYQVTPNAAWSNADLPSRRPDGTLVQRPQVALDLDYVLSFYGDEQELIPERLLGSVVRVLESRPTLTRRLISEVQKSAHFLAGSDLADAVELVRLSPLTLTLEELSRLWSVFFQTPYTLSVTYRASVVVIEGNELPERALPVRERRIAVTPFRQPQIEALLPPLITAGATLTIQGRQLQGEQVRLRVGAELLDPASITDTQLSVALPAGLSAGVRGIQVVHQLVLGTAGDPHAGVESNVAAFVLRPTVISAQATPGQVSLQLSPPIHAGQRVVLMLNQATNQAPAAYSFAAHPPDADTDMISIPISGVKAADYFVRIQVDGAESSLDLDPNSPTWGPKVTIA